MTTSSRPAEASGMRPFKAWSLPQNEMKERSDTVLSLINQGLLNDDVALIQRAGTLLAEFSAFAAQQGLYTVLTNELVSISESIDYQKAIEAIENGRISGVGLVAVFQFIAPPADVVSSCIHYAQGVVPAALEAQIRSGSIGSYDVSELTYDLFSLEDSSAFDLMLKYMLHLEQTGRSQYYSLPYVISEYFAEKGWSSLADAGKVGEFLVQQLADLQYYATTAEHRSRTGGAPCTGGTHLFSIDVLELLAREGHAAAANAMAGFHIGVVEDSPNKDVRHLSRLSQLGQGLPLKKQVLETIEGLNTLSMAELNLSLECQELTPQELSDHHGLMHVKMSELFQPLAVALHTYAEQDPKDNQLLEKAALIFDLVTEHVRGYYLSDGLDFMAGLHAVFAEYQGLDEAGKTMVFQKSAEIIECCRNSVVQVPRERLALEQVLLNMPAFPQALWESIEWMKAARLETDLGL
jgi:hypothetical protein